MQRRFLPGLKAGDYRAKDYLKNTYWHNRPLYKMQAVPDGFNIHMTSATDELGYLPGQSQERNGMPLMAMHPFLVTFVDAGERRIDDQTITRYDGQYYQRGWVPKVFAGNVEHHRSFEWFSDPLNNPDAKQPWLHGVVPLTLPLEDVGPPGTVVSLRSGPDGIWMQFRDGQHVQLDRHAWENY